MKALSVSYLADIAESECFLCESGGVSVHHICRILVRGGIFQSGPEENIEERDDGLTEEPDEAQDESSDSLESEEDGLLPDESRQRAREDKARQRVWESFKETRMRDKHCGEDVFYPFELVGKGAVLRRRQAECERQEWHALLYLFLLWLTRTSANDDHVRDARDLFERLCCHVASSYWGRGVSGESAPFIHFGEREGAFRAKIDNLAQRLGEGGGFREEAKASGKNPKDDGVDIIVHRPFADGRAGQLVGLGQCKSGHGYDRPQLSELRPDSFFRNWFRNSVSQPTAAAVRLFFLSERIANNELMFQHVNRAGILFDRCRIMEHSVDVPPDLRNEITDWILARLEESKVLGRLEAVGIGRLSKSE